MKVLPKTKLLFGTNIESFLLFFLASHWREAVEYNIENIFAISATEFSRIKTRIDKIPHRRYGKDNLAKLRYQSFFGRKPDQDFRNFFYKKQISKTSFEQFIDHICNPPYSASRDILTFSDEEFDAHIQNSASWKRTDIDATQKEQLALCDAILWVWGNIYTR